MEMEVDEIDYLRFLPEESWMRVFGYLLRNDIDNCAATCKFLREMIRRNGRYIPQRKIEYLILSARRIFSITACSGNHIKVYTFRKYFNSKTVQYNINDPRNMKVTTIVRAADGSNAELFKYCPRNVARSPPGAHLDNGLCPPELFRFIDCPLDTKFKSKFKLFTAPYSFFYKLRDLLRDTGLIEHLVFQYIAMCDAFLEKFVKTTPIPLTVSAVHHHHSHIRFSTVEYNKLFNEMLRKPETEEEAQKVKKALELTQQLAQQYAGQQVRDRRLQIFLHRRMLLLQNPPQQ